MQELLDTIEFGQYEVIVCGGGVAGIAAAISARRCGLTKVLLIEKQVNLGGLATTGLISLFEPICDGKGRVFTQGVVKELFDLAIKCGPNSLPEIWKNGNPKETDPRCSAFYSPTRFSIELDLLLENEGVELLLDTLVVKPVVNGTHCDGVIVENATGRGLFRADCIIDCTGDLSIMQRMGVPCEEGKNYLTYIAYTSDSKTCADATNGNLLKIRKWDAAGSDLWGRGHPESFPRVSGTTADEITTFVRAGRRLFLEKKKQEGATNFDIATLPSMPQLRTTRRLIGEYTLSERDEGRRFEDSIGRLGDFEYRNKLYEIPYRCLYHAKYDNLFTAGRSISSTGWAWEVTREIPGAILTGQAAGTAGAVCIQTKTRAANLDIIVLQAVLRNNGVKLHIDD